MQDKNIDIQEKKYLDSLSKSYTKLVKEFDETRQDTSVSLPNMNLYYNKLRLNFNLQFSLGNTP